jgi:D-alanine-D-alanine ligase
MPDHPPQTLTRPAGVFANNLLPRKVGITYSDVKRCYFPTEAQYITEKGAEEDAFIIGQYLSSMNIAAQLFPGNEDLPHRLRNYNPEMVINLVDSVKGKEDLASTIPGVMELLNIPYTGAAMLGLSLDTNKFLVKKILQQVGVPVPNFQVFHSPGEALHTDMRFPLISKLNSIHGSVEITADAVSENEKLLRKRMKRLIRTYKQAILVEEFINGREITAIVLHDTKKRVYLAEKIFTNKDRKYHFVSFEDQWLTEQNAAFHYKKYSDPLLSEYVKRSFDAVKMADYGKFDIRLDYSGRYYFIDSNCNPALGPKESDMALAVILDLYAVPFEEILRRLLSNTMREKSKQEITLKTNALNQEAARKGS